MHTLYGSLYFAGLSMWIWTKMWTQCQNKSDSNLLNLNVKLSFNVKLFTKSVLERQHIASQYEVQSNLYAFQICQQTQKIINSSKPISNCNFSFGKSPIIQNI